MCLCQRTPFIFRHFQATSFLNAVRWRYGVPYLRNGICMLIYSRPLYLLVSIYLSLTIFFQLYFGFTGRCQDVLACKASAKSNARPLLQTDSIHLQFKIMPGVDVWSAFSMAAKGEVRVDDVVEGEGMCSSSRRLRRITDNACVRLKRATF